MSSEPTEIRAMMMDAILQTTSLDELPSAVARLKCDPYEFFAGLLYVRNRNESKPRIMTIINCVKVTTKQATSLFIKTLHERYPHDTLALCLINSLDLDFSDSLTSLLIKNFMLKCRFLAAVPCRIKKLIVKIVEHPTYSMDDVLSDVDIILLQCTGNQDEDENLNTLQLIRHPDIRLAIQNQVDGDGFYNGFTDDGDNMEKLCDSVVISLRSTANTLLHLHKRKKSWLPKDLCGSISEMLTGMRFDEFLKWCPRVK